MFPLLNLSLFGAELTYPTRSLLLYSSLLAGFLVMWLGLRKQVGLARIGGLVACVLLTALAGGRLLHVVWERPGYFAQHPGEIFTRLDGQVFYGAFFAGALAFWLYVGRIFPEQARAKAWGLGAIGAALAVGLLRLGCFAAGCCWGKVSALPWAVRYYDPASVMPYLGIPVHPVQVYDALLAFGLAGILTVLYLRAPALRGLLGYFFCIGYALSRTATELFRGDSFRGVDLVLGMSTSQLISLALLAFSFYKLWRTPSRREAVAA
jgi:phosphatidylglycerol---prolipoprotein diacylglyceryl transferase